MPSADPTRRPDPDRLLARLREFEARAARGRLKIFFGASAGVGKTYAMLEAARKRRDAGGEVVVGYVEPHGRAETERLLEGLERLPFLEIEHRGARLREFDLDAALARRPALVLVDELAHSNAPGARHAKRWQDVEELLAAGIDVWTTVNVQHVESLNDVVAGITGAWMQETVPDRVFEQADEIELIDLPPEELLERLAQGKVYLPERARTAADNFFRKGNLIALRELALRKTAERVDAQMQSYRDEHAIRDTWAAGERLLVCVGPDSGDGRAENLIRAGKRLADALHAQWTVVSVETPALLRLPEAERNRRIALLRLAESLGAESVTLDGPNVADAVLEYAQTRNANRILVGRSARDRWRWLRPGVSDVLLARAGDLDVTVVGAESAGRGAGGAWLARSRVHLGVREGALTDRGAKLRWPGHAWAAASTVLASAVCFAIDPWFDLANQVMVYLLAVMLVALRHGRSPAVLAAVLNVVALDFLFVPPRYSFAVSDTQYLLTFAVMLAVALVIGHLVASVRLQARVAGHRERRTALLYAMSRELGMARDVQALAKIAVRHTGEVFDSQVVLLLPGESDRVGYPPGDALPQSLRGASLQIAQWVQDHGKPAGLGTDTLPGGDVLYLPLLASEVDGGGAPTLGVLAVLPANPRRVLLPEQYHLLETFAAQIALALERGRLADEARRIAVEAGNERMRSSLLASISHDLRTPLAVIAGSASTLARSGASLDEHGRRELAEAIVEQSERMTRQISNILDMTRFEAGAPQLNRDWHALEEIVGAVLARLRTRLEGRAVAATVPRNLPLVRVDGPLIEQVLSNLLENALKYTPAGSPIEIDAWSDGNAITVSVIDHGPGLSPGDEDRVFEKFWRADPEGTAGGAGLGLAICRAIVEAHGGRIWAERRFAGGTLFCFTLPLEPAPEIATEEA